MVSILNGWFLTTMPQAYKWVQCQYFPIRLIDAVLRGIGQVVFMNNTWSGAFIMAGIFVASQYHGVLMLLGTFSGTITGMLLKADPQAVSNGIYGFNACLVGIGVSLFSFGDNENWGMMP